MERETQRLVNHFVFKGRKLKSPDDARLVPSRCELARIPRKYWKTKWSYYPDDSPQKKKLLEYVDNLDNHRKDGIGLYLAGATRQGKTAAVTLIAKEIIRRDGFPLFVPCHDIAKIEMSKDPEDVELSNKMRNVTFLILDDLGADSGKETAASMVEQIIRDRDGQLLPTLFTTNIDDADVEKHFGKALFELILEMSVLVLYTK